MLMTGPSEPHFNMCKTLQDSDLVRNSTQSQFGVEWVVFFGPKHQILLFFGRFLACGIFDISCISTHPYPLPNPDSKRP